MKTVKNPRTATLVAETMEMMRIVQNIEQRGSCWIWTGAVSDNGYPIIHYRRPGAGSAQVGCQLVRRVVVRLNGGKLAPRQPVGCTCDEKLCVHPSHLFPSTTSKISQKAAKRGAFSSPTRGARIAASRRGKMKLNIDKAREIRVSSESGPVLAARYGVNKSMVNNIKAGRSWKEYGLFAGLGAR